MMDIDPTPLSYPRTSTSLPEMPENIWLDVFGYLSLEEKFRVAG